MFESNKDIRTQAAEVLFIKELTLKDIIWSQFIAIYYTSLENIKNFMIDSFNVLRGDFSQGLVRSLINWCILIDLSFSTSFLWSALFVVALNRYKIFREGCQNILQYVVDSADAPLALIATLGGVAAALIHQLGS